MTASQDRSRAADSTLSDDHGGAGAGAGAGATNGDADGEAGGARLSSSRRGRRGADRRVAAGVDVDVGSDSDPDAAGGGLGSRVGGEADGSASDLSAGSDYGHERCVAVRCVLRIAEPDGGVGGAATRCEMAIATDAGLARDGVRSARVAV